ncbi:MAG: DNA alkylation repair protein, partial [Micrococcales bacterium]
MAKTEESNQTAEAAKQALAKFANPGRSRDLGWFFKTGPGDYAEGDQFIGAKVPEVRSVAAEFAGMPLTQVQILAHSPIHEERQLANFLIINRYKKAKTDDARQPLFELWLRLGYEGCWNNWDLVDAGYVVGDWLVRHPNDTLLESLAKSSVLWERRMAVLLTFPAIKQGNFETALMVAGILHHDAHDLIHKAVGWMLREAGKRDLDGLRGFLRANVSRMPRTMLRYAIEKLDEPERKTWLA